MKKPNRKSDIENEKTQEILAGIRREMATDGGEEEQSKSMGDRMMTVVLDNDEANPKVPILEKPTWFNEGNQEKDIGKGLNSNLGRRKEVDQVGQQKETDQMGHSKNDGQERDLGWSIDQGIESQNKKSHGGDEDTTALRTDSKENPDSDRSLMEIRRMGVDQRRPLPRAISVDKSKKKSAYSEGGE
ncbi:hypothetical protein L6452_01103 [Arctium lappa]|uniref:Uncharacterized protein n=1 Tax=Arctium lappa TaxID=4217 RepID=A0ACB9FGK3_ARCLA|nr:hypothetical protein L6452_01103 [Arctium lappa]